MKLIFLKDVPGVARAGEVKEVAAGYGRNYLLPKQLAVLATAAELKRLASQKEAGARRLARSEHEAEAVAGTLAELSLVFKAKVGAADRLYGSVTSADIAKEIHKLTGHEIDKRRIELEEPLHQLGDYEVPIKLTSNVTATVKVTVEEEA